VLWCNNKRGRARCTSERKYLYKYGRDIYISLTVCCGPELLSLLHGRWQNETRRIIVVPFIFYDILSYFVLYRELYSIFFDCRYTLRRCSAFAVLPNNIMLLLKEEIVNHITIYAYVSVQFLVIVVLQNNDVVSLDVSAKEETNTHEIDLYINCPRDEISLI